MPGQFRMEKRLWPLGRYLTRRLRVACHMPEGQPAIAAELRKLEEQMRYPNFSFRKELDQREQAREQGARKAFARVQLARSKKIL